MDKTNLLTEEQLEEKEALKDGNNNDLWLER